MTQLRPDAALPHRLVAHAVALGRTFAADPATDGTLGNPWDEVLATGDVRWAVRRPFEALVDAAGLDADRARDWVVVRELHQALWCAKAVQD